VVAAAVVVDRPDRSARLLLLLWPLSYRQAAAPLPGGTRTRDPQVSGNGAAPARSGAGGSTVVVAEMKLLSYSAVAGQDLNLRLPARAGRSSR